MQALGVAIQCGSPNPLNDALPILAQRACDPIPSVRSCLAEVVGGWLLDMVDRCSHVHTHTCTCSHMHRCTHSHMHTFTHAHTHTCTHSHMHTLTCIHSHAHTHMHTLTTCIDAHTHAMCTCTHSHMYTHAHSHAVCEAVCTLYLILYNSICTWMSVCHIHVHTTHTSNQMYNKYSNIFM